MSDVSSKLERLARAVSEAKSAVQRKKVLLNKAEAALDKAQEELDAIEWAHDDLVIQTWVKPDVATMLNVESNHRYYHELRDIIKSEFNDTLYVGGQWAHEPQYVLTIFLDAGIPEQVEQVAAGIFFFINDVSTLHPDARGYGVFPVVHKLQDDSQYELWFAPSAGEVLLVKRVEGTVFEKQKYLTLRECLTFIHENLSNDYGN